MADRADVEAEIVRLAAAGDGRAAAARLVAAYRTWLTGFVRRRVPPGDVDDVCARVWEVVAAGVPPNLTHPRAWLAGVAFHKIGHALDQRRFEALDSALAERPMWAGSATSVRGQVARAEEVELVRRAIAELDPDDRELIHLAFTDGLRPAEIVAATGRSVDPKTLSKQISRLVDRLRERVKP